MQFWKLASALAVFAALFASSFAARAADAENTMIITLKDGDVTIALSPTSRRSMSSRSRRWSREGAYDNVAFHRVIDGFMAQTGDVQYRRHEGRLRRRARPAPAARTLPDLPAEFSKEPFRARHRSAWRARRTRTRPTRSSSSCSRPAPSLDGQYTVVGKVESGMELVDKIKKGDEAQQRRRQRTRPHDQGPHRRGQVTQLQAETGTEKMAEIKDPENTLLMETTKGNVVDRASPRPGARPCRAHQGTGARRRL